jgi:CubicO group peptidase (beta-lactamase class C family)
MDWETDLMGTNTGGWGLRIKTEDIAKFAQLYLQKGKWNDQQILPEGWAEEATTFKIDNAPMIRRTKKIPVTGSRVIVTSSGAAVIILFVVMVLLGSMHWFYQKKMW